MPLEIGQQLRIMSENLLTIGLTSLTSSSASVTYPLTNLTTNFRGRPFKFNGRFTIDATNNKLYFNDGSARTATIASAEYTSRTSLATAIQTAMNAVSTTCVVTWSTTLYSFIIARTGTLTLSLTNTTTAIWETIGFVDSADKSGASTYTADEKRFHWPYEYIKVDFGYFPSIGFLGLISDASVDFAITAGATIKIQANTIDSFTSPPVDVTLTRTSEGVFKFFADDDYNYRYWRLTIIDNAAIDDPAIGYMYLGEFFNFDHYNSQGANDYVESQNDLFTSESGQVYSLTRPMRKVYDNIQMEMISVTDKNDLLEMWKRVKTSEPFFISIDPALEISAELKDTTFFCRFKDKPIFEHVVGARFTTKFGVIEWL